MGYKLKQWIIEDSRTDRVWKVRGKSCQSVEKRLGKREEYITVMGTVKSLTIRAKYLGNLGSAVVGAMASPTGVRYVL